MDAGVAREIVCSSLVIIGTEGGSELFWVELTGKLNQPKKHEKLGLEHCLTNRKQDMIYLTYKVNIDLLFIKNLRC